jgi:hypothetical protein
MSNIPTDADLDASVELITFMWLATGNDPASITNEAVAVMRMLLAQNFYQLPPELQTLFANGRANNQAIQAEWQAADPLQKMTIAQQFQLVLAVLGLVPGAASGGAGYESSGESATNADIASNIAWNNSGAGDWSSR